MNNTENLSDVVGDSKTFIFNNENRLTIHKNKIMGFCELNRFDKDYNITKIYLYFEKREDMILYYRKNNPTNEGGIESFNKDLKMLQKHFED